MISGLKYLNDLRRQIVHSQDSRSRMTIRNLRSPAGATPLADPPGEVICRLAVKRAKKERISRRIPHWLLLVCAVTLPVRAQVGMTTGLAVHQWMGFQPAAALAGVDWNSPRMTNTAWWSPAVK